MIVFVNGLGGTPIAELYLMFGKIAHYCEDKQLKIERSLVGSYMTSLDMMGITLTLLKVEDEWLPFWDASVSTPGLTWE